MKNKILYITIGFFVVLIIAMALLYKPAKTFDKKVTLSYKENRPYATSICYKTLSQYFGLKNIAVEKKSIIKWKDTATIKNTLLFIVTKEFNPNEEEIQALFHYVEKGNYVFISSLNFNERSRNFFGFDIENKFNFSDTSSRENNKLQLLFPFYENDTSFDNFNKTSCLSFSLNKTDEKFFVLGFDKNDSINFMKASALNGSYFLHSDPFVFTNNALIKKSNQQYYQYVLSAIPKTIDKVIWDDFYLYRKEDYEEKKTRSLLRVLFQYPAFVWSFWLAIGIFVLYVLFYFKRQQRFVTPIIPLKNESLYFAETIGRLYFEKGDHANIGKKMSTYFLEHIRTKYLVNTSNLNKDFVEKLSLKSGYNLQETENLIQFLVNITHAENISQNDLNEYYLLIQKFYKNT